MTPDIKKVQRLIGAAQDGSWGEESDRLLDAALAAMFPPAVIDRPRFFSAVRATLFGGTLTQHQVDGMSLILDAFAGQPIPYTAYALATAYLETDKTMQPIAEYGKGRGRPYGVPGRNGGQIPYGRGLVQLTHDDNYERMDRELGLNGALVKNYDLAMQPDIAARIMLQGMLEGFFTGKGLGSYLDRSPPDYINARRIINGTDRAVDVAGFAVLFEKALRS